MIECDWCGAHTYTIEKENGEVVCGRCKRTVYEKTEREKKRMATLQTSAYKETMKDKMLYRTQGWPIREIDSNIDPELSWNRLLQGKKYNDPSLYPGYVYKYK